MKIENINSHTLARLQDRYKRANESIKEINKILAKGFHESDGGHSVSGLRTVYSLYLTEYKDSSGDYIDLTGLQVYADTLNFLLGKLQQRKTEIEQAISEL
jgi:hypothetical protein